MVTDLRRAITRSRVQRRQILAGSRRWPGCGVAPVRTAEKRRLRRASLRDLAALRPPHEGGRLSVAVRSPGKPGRGSRFTAWNIGPSGAVRRSRVAWGDPCDSQSSCR